MEQNWQSADVPDSGAFVFCMQHIVHNNLKCLLLIKIVLSFLTAASCVDSYGNCLLAICKFTSQ